MAIAAVAGAAATWIVTRPQPTPVARPARLTMQFQARPAIRPFGNLHLAVSADGAQVAFNSTQRLWIRRMDEGEARQLDDEGEATDPFFSPDGKWLGVFSANGLARIPLEGGPRVTIAPTSARPRGAVWLADDSIVFATTEGLFSVAAAGGTPRLLLKPDPGQDELHFAWPQPLPGGKAVLFTIVPASKDGVLKTGRLDLATLDHAVVLPSASGARYVATGHLVYASGSTLHAIAFDPATATTRGEPRALPEIPVATAVDNGAANFVVTESGTLVASPPRPSGAESYLAWLDRDGREERLPLEARAYGYPRVSPDGTHLAVELNRDGRREIWIVDLTRMTQTQLTDSPGEDLLPVWQPDGQRVWFASNRGGDFDIYSQAADGAAEARLEFSAPDTQFAQAFTPDGTALLVYERFRDMKLFRADTPGQLFPLLVQERFDERLAQVSRDGRWIAFESDESGSQIEIMLRPFPDVARRREKVSVNGGRYPLWAPSGTELYYLDLEGAMRAVPVTTAPELRLGAPQRLFDYRRPPEGRSGRLFDVSPKDGRFIVTRPATSLDSRTTTELTVVLNWLEVLR